MRVLSRLACSPTVMLKLATRSLKNYFETKKVTWTSTRDGLPNPSPSRTTISNGALIHHASWSLRRNTRTESSMMLCALVAQSSASFVVTTRTKFVVASRFRLGGKSFLITKTLHTFSLTLKNVLTLIANLRLKKTKGAIIWHAVCVNTTFAGFVSEHGVSMENRQVASTLAMFIRRR